MEASLLLCDWAEEIGEKLYMMGAGWTRLILNQPITNMSLGVIIKVPWTETNHPHTVRAYLVTDEGEPVMVGEGPVEVTGGFEIGRPAGVKHGTELLFPLALRFHGLPMEPGRYEWRLAVDDEPVAHQVFDVARGGTQ